MMWSLQDDGRRGQTDSDVPLSLEDLDRTVAGFETVEQLFKYLNPNSWKQDLDSIYIQPHLHYRSKAYHLAGRANKGKSMLTMEYSQEDEVQLVSILQEMLSLNMSTFKESISLNAYFNMSACENCYKGHDAAFLQDNLLFHWEFYRVFIKVRARSGGPDSSALL